MDISNGSQIINLKKSDWETLKTYNEKVEFAKENTLISITPTRIENIMLHIKYKLKDDLDDLMCVFLNKQGSISCQLYLNNVESLQDEKTAIITQIVDRNSKENFMASAMCFYCNQLANDISVNIHAYKKWSYKIRTSKLNDEFCYSDGKLHHDVGDMISYNKNIELTVVGM